MNYKKILQKYRKDRTRLIEILKEIQAREGHISEKAIICVADGSDCPGPKWKGSSAFTIFFQPGRLESTWSISTIPSRPKWPEGKR